MPAFRWSELEHEAIDGPYSPARGPVFRGKRIEAARVVYPRGTEVKPHASGQEQVHSILKGRANYRVGGEERLVGAGDAVLIRPNTEYAVHVDDELQVVLFKDVPGTADGSATSAPARGPSFFTWNEMASDFITPKYSSGRGPTLTGERIEVAFMFYPAGTEGKPHAHPNEQIQVPLAGKVRGTLGGEETIIGPGDGILFPSNVEHGAKIVEDYTTINCKDIVHGWSVYHARWEK